MPKIRHAFLRDEPLITKYGTVTLDKQGFVVDLDDLDVTPDKFLELPDLINDEIFPYRPTMQESIDAVKEKKKVESPQPPPPETSTSAEKLDSYLELMQAFLETKPKVNSEGYVDMAVLSEHLKKLGLALITGTQRKELQDRLRAQDES